MPLGASVRARRAESETTGLADRGHHSASVLAEPSRLGGERVAVWQHQAELECEHRQLGSIARM
jgi:hypothetical protein